MSQLKRPVILAVLGIALGVMGTSHAVDLQEGRRFFDRYVALGTSYNPSLATLYADSAAIKTTRRYPTGQTRSLELTGAQWKELIQKAMPLAKAQGDRSEFKNARFEAVGDDIRVQGRSLLRSQVLLGSWLLYGDQTHRGGPPDSRGVF